MRERVNIDKRHVKADMEKDSMDGGTEHSPSRKVVSKGKEKIVRSEKGEGDSSPL